MLNKIFIEQLMRKKNSIIQRNDSWLSILDIRFSLCVSENGTLIGLRSVGDAPETLLCRFNFLLASLDNLQLRIQEQQHGDPRYSGSWLWYYLNDLRREVIETILEYMLRIECNPGLPEFCGSIESMAEQIYRLKLQAGVFI
ncbi:hypothetical protein HF329_03880 [Chitinophaga oryzae]|uniref:Uncharacterized protein n=1 Tax=Chitinophaga oryzae TaxID=2725414 RepID=A0AAE6ZCK7_9BACT|nr:hypothetical protein [Chitinophaga oryzae]QJB30486.1 hypothetical protein HF329_03880 [Chitinophaga oryzae]